jgi:hypothetical protein
MGDIGVKGPSLSDLPAYNITKLANQERQQAAENREGGKNESNKELADAFNKLAGSLESGAKCLDEHVSGDREACESSQSNIDRDSDALVGELTRNAEATKRKIEALQRNVDSAKKDVDLLKGAVDSMYSLGPK